MPISPLDFVLLQFGSPGYYQVFLGFLLCCLQLPITFTEYLFKYYILEPPHRCQLSHREVRLHDSLKAFNVHKNEWFPVLDHSVAQYDHTGRSLMQQLLSVRSNHTSVQFDQCNVYLDPVHHWKGTQPCTNGWEFWLPNNEHNLVTEFSLVCERKYFVTILLYAVCMASIFGAIVFGFLADKWGRSKTVHLTIYLFVASSLSAYFSVDFIQFSVFYTLQVFFVSGLQVCVFVLLLEILPTPFQLTASLMWTIFGVLTSLLVPILVGAIHNWRYMQLSIAVPSFAFFTYIFVIPASPLWLTVVKHNLPSAFKTLSLFGKFTGKELSSSQLKQHIQNLYTSSLSFVCELPPGESTFPFQSVQQHQSILLNPKLSKPGPVLRWYLLTHFYLFFVVTLLNSQMTEQHSLVLHHNPQVNSIYNSFLRLGILILACRLSSWLGGRIVQAIFFAMDGLLIVGAVVLKEYFKNRTNSDSDESTFDYRLFLLPPSMVVLARSLSFSLVAFTWFYAVKTIPTKIRASGLGFCFFWTQIARMCVPHLVILSNYLSHNQVLIAFGALAILGGALTLFFSSMENQPLPNTLEDLQPKVSRSSDFLGSTKFKRYPSYRDLKLYFNGTTRPTAHNIYTIPPTDGSFSEHGSIRATQVKSTLLDNLDNSIPNSEQKHTVDLKELMNFIQQTSTTSNSTRLGNETEKSSLSSCQSNTLSRGTTHVRSLIHMSPSTSFANQLTNAGPSYIAYSSPSLEGENDMFTVELNNEVTVESADLARVARPSFAYARNLSS